MLTPWNCFLIIEIFPVTIYSQNKGDLRFFDLMDFE